MTNFTTSPTTLLAKTSRFLLVPEVAPWGPARLSPSRGPQHPRRGPRRLGPHTRRGRGGSRVPGARHGAALGAATPLRRHRAEAPLRPRRGGPGGLPPRVRPRGPAGTTLGLSRRTDPRRWGEQGTSPRSCRRGREGSGSPRVLRAAEGARNSEQKFAAGEECGPIRGYLKTQSSRESLAGEIRPCFLLKSFWKRVGGILGRCLCPRRRGAGLRAAPSLRRS